MKIQLPNEVKKTLKILHINGYEAYVVGGCVRDALIGIQTNDYDITTNAKPSVILEIFINYTVIQTGLAHGTVTVIVRDMPIEITTYRIDGSYVDNRHPEKVEFTQQLKDDLQRRDFTMNAIAYNEDQGLIDPFYGQNDIKNKIIRCVGNSDNRFKEDALRIIRALRFSSILGFRIDDKAVKSIHANKELLKNISIERITSEFSKMICGRYIEGNLIEYLDVIVVIIPNLLPDIKIYKSDSYDIPYDYLSKVKAIVNTPPNLHIRLALLLSDINPKKILINETQKQFNYLEESAKAIKKVLQDMRYDKNTIQKIYTLIRYCDLEICIDEKYIKRWMNKITPQVFKEVLEFRKIRDLYYHTDCNQKSIEIDLMMDTIDRILSNGDCYSIKQLAIKGDEILKLGVTPGKLVGDILNYLLDAVIEGKVSNNKAELQNLIKRNLII